MSHRLRTTSDFLGGAASYSYAVHQWTKLLIARHGPSGAAREAARRAIELDNKGAAEEAEHWRQVEAAVRRRR